MTLAQAHSALEQRGFVVHKDDASSLSAVRSDCLWEFMARFEIMTFVHALGPGQNLTLARMQHDLTQLSQRIERLYPGGCPPFGFGRGRQVIIVYLLEKNGGGEIEPNALDRIYATPDRQWCAHTFLAAQDADGASYLMEERDTPLWGRALYPTSRYYAGLLTGRAVADEQPRPSSYYKWLNLFILVFCIWQAMMDPDFIWIFGGTLIFMFVVAGLHELCKRQPPRHGALLHNQQDLEAI